MYDNDVPFEHTHFQNVGLNAIVRAETKSRGVNSREMLDGSCGLTVERSLGEVYEASG